MKWLWIIGELILITFLISGIIDISMYNSKLNFVKDNWINETLRITSFPGYLSKLVQGILLIAFSTVFQIVIIFRCNEFLKIIKYITLFINFIIIAIFIYIFWSPILLTAFIALFIVGMIGATINN